MGKKYTAHIISHSHWDREWYFPLEAYRVRLVDMIDRLMDALEADDHYHAFMLDGHTALLEDYLAVKPQNEPRLTRHIQAGRVLIGPWYILPDQMLISGEAHIRNYLFGQRLCRRFGGNMQVGYAPDAFGHPAQLPQIYQKLGLGEILFWRGLSEAVPTNEFCWKGPDGSEILGLNLAYGYGNCPNLPAEPGAFLARIEYVVQHYAPRSATPTMLIMNGRDHLEAQPHIAKIARAASALSPDIHMCHSTLPAYLAELRAGLAGKELPVHRGALHASGRVALLEGTLSARMYLKQKNQQTEDLFEQWAEPFCCISQLEHTGGYPRDLLNHGWRFLLQNHPHDSITGCSVDEVHREMMVRYASARQVGETLLSRALGEINSRETAPTDDCYLSVFNPSPYPRSQVVGCQVEMQLRLSNALVYERMRREQFEDEGANLPLPTAILLEDDQGNRLSAVLESASIEKVMRYYTHTQPHEFYAHCCRIRFVAKEVPALGCKSYRVLPSYEAADTFPQPEEAAFIENTHFRVECKNGEFHVQEKASGRWFYNCGALWDEGDAGDEYLQQTAKGPVVHLAADSVTVHTECTAVCQKLVLQGVMHLPQGLAAGEITRCPETVDCPVQLEVSITDTEPRVDFKAAFTNYAKNHRLRVAFQTDVSAQGYDCENIFCVDHHALPGEANPVATRSQKRFTSVCHGLLGCTVANRGLPEVEVRQTSSGALILLTLLRCVGIMANGPTGLNIPTPEAQCLGEHVFEYSFIPHRGNWQDSRAFQLAHAFCAPLCVKQMEDGKRPLQGQQSWLSVSAPELVLSAFKLAEDLENTFILRFYNSSEKTLRCAVTPGFHFTGAYLCDLREQKTKTLDVDGKAILLEAHPWEIVTIGLHL